MRKILNYLLGEDSVNEQSDKELKDTLIGGVMCATLVVLSVTAICILG